MTEVDDVPAETTVLQAVRASTATLLDELTAARWSDADAHTATDLPDWTRGHVLSHLARNADGMAGVVGGGLRGEPVPMYPSRQARADDIEAGAGRPVLDLITDVRESAERLDRVLAAVADGEDWTIECGDGRMAGDFLLMRWCEVEIHRLDLGLATTADWPAEFVARILPMSADPPVLARRIDRPVRLVVEPGGAGGELDDTVWAAAPDADEREPIVVTGTDLELLTWLIGRDGGTRPESGIDLAEWRLFPN